MRFFVAFPCFMLFTPAGCGKKNVETAKMPGSEFSSLQAIQERTTPEGDLVVEVDLDGDSQVDIYNYFRTIDDQNRLLIRKEVDLNRDGKIDVWSYFTETGELEREEMDSDFDGKVDWIDHYKGEKRVMSEVDTKHDGVFDLFKYYEADHIKNKERDTNGDGRIDHWEYFDAEGNVIMVGWDIDNDGQMDIREE